MHAKFTGLIVAAAFLAANGAFAAPPAPQPACAAALDGPEYVPGVDARGQPLPRADIGAEHVAIPDQILVPLPDRAANQRSGRAGQGAPGNGRLPGDGAYAAIDGRRLAGLLNPPPCDAAKPR